MLAEVFDVTYKENVLPTGELKDDSVWGVATSEHVLPITNINPETGAMETKIIQRLGVRWNHIRVPAISYHDPSELFCLDVESSSEDSDEIEGYQDSDENENELEI